MIYLQGRNNTNKKTNHVNPFNNNNKKVISKIFLSLCIPQMSSGNQKFWGFVFCPYLVIYNYRRMVLIRAQPLQNKQKFSKSISESAWQFPNRKKQPPGTPIAIGSILKLNLGRNVNSTILSLPTHEQGKALHVLTAIAPLIIPCPFQGSDYALQLYLSLNI